MRAIFFNSIFLGLVFLSNNILSQNLIAHYPFNGNANDTTPNGYNGQNNGGVFVEDRFGKPSSAIEFNGFSSYFDSQNNFDFQERTVSVWIKPYNVSAPDIKTALTLDNSNNNYGQIIIRCDGGSWQFRAGGEINRHYYSAIPNKWYHIVLVRTSSSTYYYVDGQQIGSANSGNLFSSASSSYPNLLCGIGRRLNEQYFHGAMDDLIIFNDALDSFSVQDLYQSTNCFKTNNLPSITICPTQSVTTPKGNLTSIPGTFRDTLASKLGCDSVVSLEVKYNESPSQCDSIINNSSVFGPRLILYPNPTSDYFFIEVFGLTNYNVSVYDNRGRLVFLQENLQNSLNKYFLGRLAAGVYTVSISSNNYVISEKLVIY